MEWHRTGHQEGVDFPEVEITKIWEEITNTLVHMEILKPTVSDIERIQHLALEYECRVNPVYPMPNSREIIGMIKEKDLVLGIVSNAQFYTPLLFSAFFKHNIENLGFDPDCCIWSFKELRAKPSVTLFKKLGKFLKKNHGIELSETLYIGNDMLNDVYCASQAGCRTVLFAGDKRSLRLRENDDRCSGSTPDAIATALSQLSKII
jgi:putative hydrolase of the HAD superfamily